MSNFLKKNKFNLIRFILLIPILMVAVISISHVVSWYEIANPFKWAVYLSISVEIAAMVSILSFSLRMKGGAWAIFFIVTFIQMIGNIFFSFKEIDSNGDLFKSWVELTGPLWEMMGSDPTDVVAMKRWLAFLEGGLLPIISLTSLHFFVKYDGSKVDTVSDTVSDTVNEVVSEGVSEGVNLDDEGVLAPNSITNSTYEITKEIFESNEKSESLSDVETFLDESQYLNLQESDNPVIETTETISDDIREIIDEVITTENTKFPMDMML
jgi:hypothetical protein